MCGFFIFVFIFIFEKNDLDQPGSNFREENAHLHPPGGKVPLTAELGGSSLLPWRNQEQDSVVQLLAEHRQLVSAVHEVLAVMGCYTKHCHVEPTSHEELTPLSVLSTPWRHLKWCRAVIKSIYHFPSLLLVRALE